MAGDVVSYSAKRRASCQKYSMPRDFFGSRSDMHGELTGPVPVGVGFDRKIDDRKIRFNEPVGGGDSEPWRAAGSLV